VQNPFLQLIQQVKHIILLGKITGNPIIFNLLHQHHKRIFIPDLYGGNFYRGTQDTVPDFNDFRINVIDAEQFIFIFGKIENRFFPEEKLESSNFGEMEIMENRRIFSCINDLLIPCHMDPFNIVLYFEQPVFYGKLTRVEGKFPEHHMI